LYKKVDGCKLCYEYVLHDCWIGDVLKETTMANERWWKGPGMVALTSTEPIPYWFLLAQKPKQLSDPGINYSSGW
jgi:hypothetical protein